MEGNAEDETWGTVGLYAVSGTTNMNGVEITGNEGGGFATWLRGSVVNLKGGTIKICDNAVFFGSVPLPFSIDPATGEVTYVTVNVHQALSTDSKIGIVEYDLNEYYENQNSVVITDVAGNRFANIVGNPNTVSDALLGVFSSDMNPGVKAVVDGTQLKWVVDPTAPQPVTINPTEGGTVELSPAEAAVGTQVTVVATPDEGKVVGTITVKDKDGNDVTVTNGKFDMPAGGVTVDVTFKDEDPTVTEYTITVEEAANGTVTTNPSGKAEEGTEVTVTATPANGYVLDTLTYTPEGGSATDIKSAKKFNMPAANVTVNATFKQDTPVVTEYDVTVATGIQNGTVTVNPTKAAANAEVTVTATPATGYVVDKITYTPAGGTATDITSAKKFNMPAANVTVNATFKVSGGGVFDDVPVGPIPADTLKLAVENKTGKTTPSMPETGTKNADGTITISVAADSANPRDVAVVAYSDDNWTSYRVIKTPVKNGNNYDFTIDEVPEGRKLVIVKLGDVNTDGKVRPTDATLLKKFNNELDNLEYWQKIAADVNEDGKLRPTDVTALKKFNNELLDFVWTRKNDNKVTLGA
jgi:hypothetical protein